MIAEVDEHGYAGASVAGVLARAGLSRKALYRHFDGKEACFLAAYDEITDGSLRAMQSALEDAAGWPEGAQTAISALLDLRAARCGVLFTDARAAPIAMSCSRSCRVWSPGRAATSPRRRRFSPRGATRRSPNSVCTVSHRGIPRTCRRSKPTQRLLRSRRLLALRRRLSTPRGVRSGSNAPRDRPSFPGRRGTVYFASRISMVCVQDNGQREAGRAGCASSVPDARTIVSVHFAHDAAFVSWPRCGLAGRSAHEGSKA
jgi:AcrR family transcriptional regulator